jgi:uncharacterized membrane protein
VAEEKYQRFWEIDAVRGIAIIVMIFIHLLWDLQLLADADIDMNQPAWHSLIMFGRYLFVFIVGISLSLSYSRWKNKGRSEKSIGFSLLKRGVFIFALGVGITVATYLFDPKYAIYFGVLHMIGLSILISYPFLRYPRINLPVAFIFLIAGMLIDTIRIGNPSLVWLGITSEGFRSMDYFPLLPGFGFVLLGMVLGNLLYPDFKRRFSIVDLSRNHIIGFISKCGKNTLWIYLIHQPILAGGVLLLVWMELI